MTILWESLSIEENCTCCTQTDYQVDSEALENQNIKAMNNVSPQINNNRMHTLECKTKTNKKIRIGNHERHISPFNQQCYIIAKLLDQNVIEVQLQISSGIEAYLVYVLLRLFDTDRLAQLSGKAVCQTCRIRYPTCLKHHCSDHNSSSKHLCKCKLCRDKIGELFSNIQKHLLFVHFTRRELGLLCGCVTCNVGHFHCIQHWPFKKCIPMPVNGNGPCTHLDLQYRNLFKKRIVCLPSVNCDGSGRSFVQFYGAIVLIMLFMVHVVYICVASMHTLLANSQDATKKPLQRKYIYLLSSVLILAWSCQTEHELPQREKRKNKNIFADNTLTEILLYLQKSKSKTPKMILHDIIYHLSPKRNDVLALYPVSRRGKEEMASELLRLGSFHNFPHDNTPSLLFLAKSGFYYEGKGREVVCFSCGITHDDWSYNSKPYEVHYRISPECPYLKDNFPLVQTVPSASYCEQIPLMAKDQTSSYMNIEADSIQPCTDAAGNLPPTLLVSSSSDPRVFKNSIGSGYIGSSYISSQNISGRSQHSTLLTSTSKDSGYGSSVGSNSSSSGISSQNNQQTPVLGSATDRSFQTFEGNTKVQAQSTATTPKEKYPEYKLIERRRNTYKNWPSNLSFLHPLDLSECGFFYSNFGDCVRCFHCGIGLRNWEADDNPWVEHARWSRKCPYLLQRKGQGFIDSVLTVLGLQTDAEIDQQTNNAGSEQSSQASSGYGTVSNDVRNPIQHPSAQYVLTEKIFGENKDRLVKMTMNQLLQAHDWNDITNDMLVNAVLEHKDGTEFMETRNNPADLSESKSQSSANLESENQKSKQLLSPAVANVTESSDSDIDNSEKIQKENEELKDLYTCKICLDERVGITFVPCGHLVTCKNCSPKIRRCPLCREFIRGTIKTTL